MKKVLATVFLIITFIPSASAGSPTVEWIRQFGTPSTDEGWGVSLDGTENVYVSGTTYGDLAGVNAGDADAFLSKYSSTGSLIWSRQFGGSSTEFGYGDCTDSLGN